MRDMDTPLGINERGGLRVNVTAGATLFFYYLFSEDDGSVIDLAGATFETALRYGKSADSDAVDGVELAVANRNDTRRGLVYVSIPADKTLLLPTRCYGEIRATLGNGKVAAEQVDFDVKPTRIREEE